MKSTQAAAGRSRLLILIPGILLLAAGLIIGRLSVGDSTEAPGPEGSAAGGEVAENTVWTCSMHPQIRQPDPGKCPICAMDLIPLKMGTGQDPGPRMMSMSEEAMGLAEIRTQRVERRFVDMEIPLVGKVDFDESRVKTISAWVPGRLDRLFVDYTGVPVKAGEHLVEMFSPELYAAQEELLQNLETVKNLENSESMILRESALEDVEAVREKLRFLGLTQEQIQEIQKRGTPSATVEIKAPIGGIVIAKNAKEGMYVQTGTPIYTVADLSRVWVNLDAYESDLPWIRYGQEVGIRIEAYGDKAFQGWISFIDPVLDPGTRTVRVRVIVDNETGELRPNMFVRAVVKSRAARENQVLSRNLKDKYTCPMHPEVVRDGPGSCDQCGMDLVPAESLGYIGPEEADPPMVVPASAVLATGKRAVVYVRVPGREEPTFEGVEVRLGPRAGSDYIVRSGLKEGQEVVTNGNFKIDSALQLQAKPSMMSPADTPWTDSSSDPRQDIDRLRDRGMDHLSAPAAFVEELGPLYADYLAAQVALADDEAEPARVALGALARSLDRVDGSALDGEAWEAWTTLTGALRGHLDRLDPAAHIERLREEFFPISNTMIRMVFAFGHGLGEDLKLAFCPMARDDRGAHWLQYGEIISNPYFGSAMLRCGEVQMFIPTRAAREQAAEAVEVPGAFRSLLANLFKGYLGVQESLANDQPADAARAAGKLYSDLEGMQADALSPEALDLWTALRGDLMQSSGAISNQAGIQKQRELFVPLSQAMEGAVRRFGPLPDVTVRRFFCPMAFNNKGAYWLQEGETVFNPYFGDAMLRCGEMTETISMPKEEGGRRDGE